MIETEANKDDQIKPENAKFQYTFDSIIAEIKQLNTLQQIC